MIQVIYEVDLCHQVTYLDFALNRGYLNCDVWLSGEHSLHPGPCQRTGYTLVVRTNDLKR